MRNHDGAKTATRIILLLAVLTTAGCSLIMGTEDAPAQKVLSFRFVETLRNEASLRGESLRESAPNADRATTLQQPNSVYADAFRVYVTDFLPARVFVFDRGERKTTILDNTSQIKLINPGAITVDAIGTVWVSDTTQGRVFGFDRFGKLLYTIGKMAEIGLPSGLASDHRRNRLYVADEHSHQVKVFDSLGGRVYEGSRVLEIGTSGRPAEDLKFPGALTLDREGNLYVLDTVRRRVQVYAPDGKFVRGVNFSGTTPGQAVNPKGIALDSEGHLYVTDMVSNNVLVFDREGVLLLTWGRTGTLIGDFWSPAGIFIDDQDTIYIADQTNSRVQVFQYYH